jgi:uncharacterized protein (UPF0264 family)
LKLLISCGNETEASAAIAGGADIVDVKNPKEGALGASFPWMIKQVRDIVAGSVEVSCTLGDLPNLPGSVSLAALGAAATGVDYVKISLGGVKTVEQAVYLLLNAVNAAKGFNPEVKIVATGYADANKVGCLSPFLIPQVAHEAKADVAMVDTAVKNGGNLFTFLTEAEIKRIVDDAHDRGLQAALAGSLRKEQLPEVFELNADIVGVRGAACTNGDRLNGQVTLKAVRELAGIVKSLQLGAAIVL